MTFARSARKTSESPGNLAQVTESIRLRGKAKPYQVRQVLLAIDRLERNDE